MKFGIITLGFLLLSGSLLAQQEIFVIESEITIGNEIIGTPVMSVTSGNEASISVRDSYDLALMAVAHENSEILVSTELTVQGETVSSSALVKAGQPFGIHVGDIKLSMIIRPSFKPSEKQ